MILEHWNKCLWLEGQLFYMEWFCLLWNALSQTLVLILLSQVFVGYVWDVSTFLVTASRTFHATFAKWTHWKSCVSTITHCCHHRPLWVSHVELLVSHGRWELCVRWKFSHFWHWQKVTSAIARVECHCVVFGDRQRIDKLKFWIFFYFNCLFVISILNKLSK